MSTVSPHAPPLLNIQQDRDQAGGGSLAGKFGQKYVGMFTVVDTGHWTGDFVIDISRISANKPIAVCIGYNSLLVLL